MFSRGSICSCCRGRRPAEGSQAIVRRTAPPLVKRRPRAFPSHGSNTFGWKRLQHAASLADPTAPSRRALSQAVKHEFAGNFLGFVNTKSCAGVSLRATAWQLFWQRQLFEDMFEDMGSRQLCCNVVQEDNSVHALTTAATIYLFLAKTQCSAAVADFFRVPPSSACRGVAG